MEKIDIETMIDLIVDCAKNSKDFSCWITGDNYERSKDFFNWVVSKYINGKCELYRNRIYLPGVIAYMDTSRRANFLGSTVDVLIVLSNIDKDLWQRYLKMRLSDKNALVFWYNPPEWLDYDKNNCFRIVSL